MTTDQRDEWLYRPDTVNIGLAIRPSDIPHKAILPHGDHQLSKTKINGLLAGWSLGGFFIGLLVMFNFQDQIFAMVIPIANAVTSMTWQMFCGSLLMIYIAIWVSVRLVIFSSYLRHKPSMGEEE